MFTHLTPRPVRRSGTTSTRWDRWTTLLLWVPIIAAFRFLGDLVYLGTLDSKLVALNAKKPGTSFGQSDIADPELGYSETMAPTVIKDKVLIGTKRPGNMASEVFVKAYDAKTGKLLWDVLYNPGEFRRRLGDERRPPAETCTAISRLKKDQLAKTGDPYQRFGWRWCGKILPSIWRRNRIYFVVGNPSPDLDGSKSPRGQPLYELVGFA